MVKKFGNKSNKSSNKIVKDMLPDLLKDIEKKYFENPKLIVNYWPKIIGKKLTSMTEVLSFKNKTLYVLVKSSTLYSILTTQEKSRLLKLMQKKISKEAINNIVFKIG